MKLNFAWKPVLVQSQIVGLLVVAQFITNMWTDHAFRLLTPDVLLLHIALFGSVNLAIVYIGDRLARRNGWWQRSKYMAIGALASTVAHAIALAPAGYVQASRDGSLFLIIAVPALIGAAAAFLMHFSLGYSSEDDDPQQLAAIAAIPGGSAPALYDIGSAQYYGGPLQIRTSSMAAFLAAAAGSTLYSLTVVFSFSDGIIPIEDMPPLYRSNPVLMILVGIGFYTLLFFFFVRKSHAFLQARGKDGMGSYAKAGIFVPLGFAVALIALMGPFGVITVLPWILPSVLAMVTYHRIAGFEPLALPGDIEVSDPRTLIPADHIRRRVRRITPSS